MPVFLSASKLNTGHSIILSALNKIILAITALYKDWLQQNKKDDTKNELLDKGIILPSGEIGKDKINLAAGVITQPFAEMVWVTTGGGMEAINRLTYPFP